MTTLSPPSSEVINTTERGQLFMNKRLWLIVVVLFIAGFAVRTSVTKPAASSSAPDTDVEITYDGYSKEISSVLYNPDGTIDYTLTATDQTHFLDNSTFLANPFVRLYQDAGPRWNIVARSGRILGAAESDDIERLDLSDAVELYQIDETGNRMMLVTEFVSIYPRTKTMNTDQEVTMTTNTLTQTALGMRADLTQDRLTFLSQVRGRYEAPSN